MVWLSLVSFIIIWIWKIEAFAQGRPEGLALAQLSRSKRGASVADGVVQASPVTKAEDLAFIAPSRPPLQGKEGSGNVDVLKDLQILDTVLLASVDGRFHAVNRSTGRSIWSMEDDSSAAPSQSLLHNLVRTNHNLNLASIIDPENQDIYIVEPQSGDIFILSPVDTEDASPEPLRRLPYSVPQLVEHSPFSYDGPNRVFVGKKETSIIEIDLDDGIINSVIGGNHSWSSEDQEDEDEEEDSTRPRRRRVVHIGRTDYTVKVFSHNVLLQTLSFSSYGPNNMNKQIQEVWTRTPDDVYLQPSWDGQTLAFDTKGKSALWGQLFRKPIVAIFDIVTQGSGPSAKPIVLLQPRPKLQELVPIGSEQLGNMPDKTVVNRIGDSLFAMSHVNYPLVNLANTYQRIDGSTSTTAGAPDQNTPVCEGLNCFVGVRLAQRDDEKSRISRLIESGPAVQSSPGDNSPRDAAEQDPLAPILADVDPTSSTTADVSLPSRFSTATSVNGQQTRPLLLDANFQPRHPNAPGWTLLIPLMGGFLAVWMILRKFMRPSHSKPERSTYSPRESLEATGYHSPRSHFRPSSPIMSSQVYPVFAGTSTFASSSGTLNHTDPASPISILQEKEDHDPEKDDLDINVSLALEEARVGSGLGVSTEIKDGDESEKDEAEQAPGKKKKKRGGRGKKNKTTQAPGPSSPASNGQTSSVGENASGNDSHSGSGFVMVEREPAPMKMELPAPATTSSSSLIVGNKILGYGSHGTIVYEGSLQGRAVAVKRLLQDFVTLASHEVSLLLQADDHPNVIRYFFSMTRESFLYIALELCPCSLADLIETPHKHPEVVGSFDPKKALSEITQGLRHLHNLKIVHRDIKPQNILVSRRKGDGQHRMLISDFGLCKKLDVDQTSFLPTMAAGGGQSLFAAGTPGWRAPEILRGDVNLEDEVNNGPKTASDSGPGSSNPREGEMRLTKSVDVFALGCLFYYTLVGGEHPFGERYIREINILKGTMDLSGLERFGEEGAEATDLLEWMLHSDPKARPDTDEILLHPFFWTPAKRLAFLQDASDRFEIMEREPRERGLIALETGAFDVVGYDWHKRLDKVFIDNLGKYRKYQGASVQDLLRALRNKKHHYQDLPDNVKRHLGPLPDGFLAYFTKRFPALFLHVYSVVSDLPLRYEPMFKTYFELEH
ncbi:bifunctional endoribonuclease/protein kinase ire1 [Serendipita sp. 400]|nr:bifunctional endoribonuclease/protein kinase ire1 [Serendipita sp. 400]